MYYRTAIHCHLGSINELHCFKHLQMGMLQYSFHGGIQQESFCLAVIVVGFLYGNHSELHIFLDVVTSSMEKTRKFWK